MELEIGGWPNVCLKEIVRNQKKRNGTILSKKNLIHTAAKWKKRL